MVSTHTFRTWMKSNSLWHYKLLLNGQGKVHLVKESKSRLEASRQSLGPCQDQIGWLEKPIVQTQNSKLSHHSCHANGGLSMRRPGNSKTNGSAHEGSKLHVQRHKRHKGSMAQGDWQTGADCILLFIACWGIHISQHSVPHTAVLAGRYNFLQKINKSCQ